MTLADFLKNSGQKNPEFAEVLGVSRQALDRYLKGRVPERDVMRKIIELTAGAVTPNDFYPEVGAGGAGTVGDGPLPAPAE